jgi:hypothetical protein
MEVLLNHCSEFGCYQHANYHYLSCLNDLKKQKGIYCYQHKKNKMISLKDFKAGYNVKTIDIKQNNNINKILEVTKEDIIIDHLDYQNKDTQNIKQNSEIKNNNLYEVINTTKNIIQQNKQNKENNQIIDDYVMIDNMKIIDINTYVLL